MAMIALADHRARNHRIDNIAFDRGTPCEIIRHVIGGMLRILVIGLVLLVATMMLMPRGRVPVLSPETATVLPTPRELPAVQLIDQDANAFTTEMLAGQFSLMFFGFTQCPDICPLTLQVLANVRSELETRAPALVPQLVFVSVDPYRDTPNRIRNYLANFDPDFIGVTASDDALAPLLEALGVSVHKTEQDGEYYNVVHNGTIYVLDNQSRWVALFGGSSHDPAVVASDYLRIRQGNRAVANQ